MRAGSAPDLAAGAELDVARVRGIRDRVRPLAKRGLDGVKNCAAVFDVFFKVPVKLVPAAVARGVGDDGDDVERFHFF